MPQHWTAADLPSQTGKLALITGANSGIGFHAARHLIRVGAGVILSGRSLERVEQARARILAEFPGAPVYALHLDLSSLSSIHAAAEHFLSGATKLDLLINNAGVMAMPKRQETADGFEAQIGTNHLGHFALTGLLLPALLAAPAARIVTVSSIAHRGGEIRFDDLHWRREYKPMGAYRQTKFANLLFGYELERKLRQAGTRATSVVVHPGVANTNLFKVAAGEGLKGKLAQWAIKTFTQTDEQGSLPTLYGAGAPEAQGGHFYGPHGFKEMRGYPVEVKPEAQANDVRLASRLWTLSEKETEVVYIFNPHDA